MKKINLPPISSKNLATAFTRELGSSLPNLALIDQLCHLAFSKDKEVALSATKTIFNGIIEFLCDDFSDKGVTTCNLVLTRILDFIRNLPEGSSLHALLNDFGFSSSEDILNRYQKIAQLRPMSNSAKQAVKKILILSRVTAGADIAITSVITYRLGLSFPKAEIVLIGPAHLSELNTSQANIRFVNYIYRNNSNLFDKMTSWPHLLKIAQRESQGFAPQEVLLFDPDTRMTQLGLLPLLPDKQTYYFPSRASVSKDHASSNLSKLTNHWLNQLLDENISRTPVLTLPSEGSGYNTFCRQLKKNSCKFVVTINFGVGNDPRKKIPGAFEEDLIKTLLQPEDIIVVLDTGRGPLENQRAQYHLNLLQAKGISTDCIRESEIKVKKLTLTHGLISFKGSLGSLGKMIDASDCFIGYDSCGQHLAAATGTPEVIIFAGAPSQRFINRWSPLGPSNTCIPVDSSTMTKDYWQKNLISKINSAINAIRRNSIATQ